MNQSQHIRLKQEARLISEPMGEDNPLSCMVSFSLGAGGYGSVLNRVQIKYYLLNNY
jgi:hypothetical protein